MREPTMDHDGHNFERTAILDWIQRGEDNIGIGICPISHKPLRKSDLVPNPILKETIRRWSKKQGCCRNIGSIPDKHLNRDIECGRGAAAAMDDQHHDTDNSSQHDAEEEADTASKQDSLELGGAIKSLSTVLSAKEDYVVEFEDETRSIVEETVQDDLQNNDISASLLLNMFLPQEREAMVTARRRARERADAERMARFARASIAISTVVVSLLLLLFLAKLFLTKE